MVLCLFVAVSLHRAGLRCGLPVQDQRDRCGGGFFRQLIDQETAVARYGVLGPEHFVTPPATRAGNKGTGVVVSKFALDAETLAAMSFPSGAIK